MRWFSQWLRLSLLHNLTTYCKSDLLSKKCFSPGLRCCTSLISCVNGGGEVGHMGGLIGLA